MVMLGAVLPVMIGLIIAVVKMLAESNQRHNEAEKRYAAQEQEKIANERAVAAVLTKMEANSEGRDKTLALVQQSMANEANASQSLIAATNTSNEKLDGLTAATKANAPLIGQLVEQVIASTKDNTDAMGAMTIELSTQGREQTAGLTAQLASVLEAAHHAGDTAKNIPNAVWVTEAALELAARLTMIEQHISELKPTTNTILQELNNAAKLREKFRQDVKLLFDKLYRDIALLSPPPIIPANAEEGDHAQGTAPAGVVDKSS